MSCFLSYEPEGMGLGLKMCVESLTYGRKNEVDLIMTREIVLINKYA